MSGSTTGEIPRVLLIGAGDLTIRLGHLLASAEPETRIVLASRSLERATRFANLTKLAAGNLGHAREVEAVALDLADVDRTAEELRCIRPTVIFLGASIQAARAIMDLPEELFRRLDEAQLGPWLPMHLTLAHELMQAVRLAESEAVVVNGAYPDAVGPALATIGLAPDVGIGNIGNIVPGITWAAAEELGVSPAEVGVKAVGHHYFSHHVHRFGEARGIPHLLDVRVGGTKAEIDTGAAYARLAGGLRRQGGKEGQQLTATSAARLLLALLSHGESSLHAPAPGGMVGGYPVRVSSDGVRLDLPPGIDPSAAETVNRQCQRLDGIERVAANGTVHFTEERMAVMRDMLGYHCSELKVTEARAAATELAGRYDAFLRRHGLGA
ncbi:hypothetical protein [Streptomyces sp. NRRL S-31]|uniref:hypothetical protein n=1 Tax=Streptomyces sp. NRRL S-31 TaxID=1463898 RepID=UPI0004C9E3EC|nr:hypothetical protein [Streptomyces sp. NRRL S-31]